MITAWRKWVSFSVIVLIVLALVYALLQNRSESSSSLRIGKMAPDFTATTLDGSAVSLSDYRGKGVLLNFWGSWCEPCVSEMPRMNTAYLSGLSGVVVIAVNVGESRGSAAEFVSKHGLKFPILLDPGGEAAGRYGVVGLPATFLIDGEGRLKKIIPGELPQFEGIMALLKEVQS
ncbi:MULTISPECIES: redoxin domain-containing protein [unclassified Paenibacillus]|uniref:redoxin domain-containing protein n=1 Tax=unclassified Paenibacillus TaxID=185978 RepID=UPI00211734D5|nr:MULTISPECIES: redoxin domain-containing protein [unclassified Paenibacillus]